MLICSNTCDVEPSGDLSRPECLRSGADHDSAEIPGRGPDLSSGLAHVILHWTYKKTTLKKWVRILGVGGVRDSWKITGYHHPTIQGTAPTECWTGFCRLGSSCSEGMSLFALVCRSAAGRHRRCAGWAPACSCWSPHAPGNQGSPVGGWGVAKSENAPPSREAYLECQRLGCGQTSLGDKMEM